MKNSKALKAIGQEILQARLARKMTQKELAENSLLAQPQLSLLERGEKNILVSVLERVTDALGMELTVKDKCVQSVTNSVSYYDVEKDKTISRLTGNVSFLPNVGELIILQGIRYRVTNKVYKLLGRQNSCLISVKAE